MSYNKDQFTKLLQDFAREFRGKLSTKDGDWIVKGFIDVFKNVYTISDDTKVVSKLIEIMLLPVIAELANKKKLKIILTSEQNHYPDVTFIDDEDNKFAVDFKSAYRVDESKIGTMTLGAFTGYFRNRDSHKNTTFPYNDYVGHYVLGVIYSRADARSNEMKKFDLSKLKSIPSVVRNFTFFAQPKYKIANDHPGSGNTKNIGSISLIDDLTNGKGPFSERGEEVFDDYWMYYLTKDMAAKVELEEPPYKNLETYDKYKKGAKGAAG